MSVNKNIEDERLSLLKERFNLLRMRLEATAYQIKLLGGSLPIPDDEYLRGLEDRKAEIDAAMLRENEWSNKIMAAMRAVGRSCAAKEISEILYRNQSVYSLSSIHLYVKHAMSLLAKDGWIGVHPNRYQKYFLKENPNKDLQ